jgi:hypothetical protein
MIYEAN